MGSPVVKVREGHLRGFIEKNIDGGEYFAFRGVPYAEPPLGDLRFKEPRRPRPWSGIRDVGKVSPKSVQQCLFTRATTGDEDCLYLNIATNSLIGKRPVMVWIHGGGFIIGDPYGEQYGPDYLIKHDIVFVGITYRLGCLGFLNLDIPEAAGNQGLKDQVAALKWIRDNIHAFGGDPDNVTIFGESSGAVCVHLLTLSPLATGLFHKAIAQSGVCTNPWTFEKNPTDYALRLTENVGKMIQDPEEAWKFLMSATTDELIEGQKMMSTGNMDFNMILNFVPTVDRQSLEPFMPEPPSLLSRRGVNVPLIIGYTSDEGIIHVAGPDYEDTLIEARADFPKILARDMKVLKSERFKKIANSVRNYYFGEKMIISKAKKLEWSKLKGNIHFINGIQEIADLQMEKSTPTYLYRFSYRANHRTLRSILKCDLEGACHGEDNGTLFHSTLLLRNKTYERGTRDRLIMERMTRMWTNFAKTGNPTPELSDELPIKWEPLRKGEKNYLEINDDLVLGMNPDQEIWDFWKNILENLQ